MSKFKKKKGGDLPAISTASLPDIVFMLLFFFMVATVMRDSTLMIVNVLPAADQIQKLDKKDRVMYIYAGRPSSRYSDKYGTGARIQLNDKFATVEEVGAFVLAERARINHLRPRFVSICKCKIKMHDFNEISSSRTIL